MHEELVKALRDSNCATKGMCGMCPKRGKPCIYRFASEAADAIEELQQIAGHYEEAAKDYFKDVCYYLERVPKWIPVTERLPEKPGSYLVYVYGDVTEMTFWHGKWHILGDDHTKSVSHWMPLPAPPKDGEA